MDYLDRLYENNKEFFDMLFVEIPDVRENWDDDLEPDEEFMAISDANAEQFILDMEDEDENLR